MAKDIDDIAGVGGAKADALREAGYSSVEAVREASQEELSEIEGIGNALAARIKADVDDVEVTEETDDDLAVRHGHVDVGVPQSPLYASVGTLDREVEAVRSGGHVLR